MEYARWRTDKESTPGYTPELISIKVDPKYYDDLGSKPRELPIETLLEAFERNVTERPNSPYLGWRVKQADGSMSPHFVWKTNAEVAKVTQDVAKGLMAGDYCP